MTVRAGFWEGRQAEGRAGGGRKHKVMIEDEMKGARVGAGGEAVGEDVLGKDAGVMPVGLMAGGDDVPGQLRDRHWRIEVRGVVEGETEEFAAGDGTTGQRGQVFGVLAQERRPAGEIRRCEQNTGFIRDAQGRESFDGHY